MPCTVVAPRFGRVSPVFLFTRLTAEPCTLVALAICDNVFVAMRAPELYDRWFFIFMPAPVLLAAGSRTELLINASLRELCFAIRAYHVFTSYLIFIGSNPLSRRSVHVGFIVLILLKLVDISRTQTNYHTRDDKRGENRGYYQYRFHIFAFPLFLAINAPYDSPCSRACFSTAMMSAHDLLPHHFSQGKVFEL